ncbi:PIN domain-containing protein [Melioribacter sp. Ez-97]|jgi:hypothetical protein|uniref:PIN domain-containing protein n=1 Tax=Melioribacter sp. Ez-97 TaxID=3423434 RepID=UPI003ED99823
MAFTKILLDTNAYLRLGNSIRPLLSDPFGTEQYALFIHKDLQKELNRSYRIQTKYYWLDQQEYREERKKIINTSKAEKARIDKTYDFIWDYQNDEGLSLSREDILCIAVAYELKIILVTDDEAMIKVARDFDVDVRNTLELLKLMKDNKKIDLPKIEEIVNYWYYLDDLPANFEKDYKRLFKKNPPKKSKNWDQ